MGDSESPHPQPKQQLAEDGFSGMLPTELAEGSSPPQIGPLIGPSIVEDIAQPIYTPAEIAKRWGCSAEVVRHLIHCGQLAGFRVGPRLLRVRAEALAEYELRRASSPGVLGPRPLREYTVADKQRSDLRSALRTVWRRKLQEPVK